jgi:hypothetical protein
MARKISGGLSGGPNLGAINVDSQAVVTAVQDQNITISPLGTGSIIFTSNALLNSQNDLRFADSDSSNWVAFQAPASVPSNVTWTLPSETGTNGQVFTATGSGVIAWSTPQVSITDNTVDSNLYNLAFTTASSGLATGLTVSSTKLRFRPSTGNLTVSGQIDSAGAVLQNGFTKSYTESSATRDSNGFITAYTANGISYTNIVYELVVGAGADFGATYRRPISYTETDTVTLASRSVTITYDDASGRVASVATV